MAHLSANANSYSTLNDFCINKYIYMDSSVIVLSDRIADILFCLFPAFNSILYQMTVVVNITDANIKEEKLVEFLYKTIMTLSLTKFLHWSHDCPHFISTLAGPWSILVLCLAATTLKGCLSKGSIHWWTHRFRFCLKESLAKRGDVCHFLSLLRGMLFASATLSLYTLGSYHDNVLWRHITMKFTSNVLYESVRERWREGVKERQSDYKVTLKTF